MRAERLTLTLIAISLPLSVLISLSIGPYRSVDFPVLVAVLMGLPVSRLSLDVLTYRAIRTLAAGVLGAGLAVSGSTLQFTLRNPLADPYLAGVASGSLLGVTLALLWGRASFWDLYAAAIVGGLLTLLAVITISGLAGGGAVTLLVVGVAFSYVLSGLTMFFMIMLGPKLPGALYWMFGSVAFVTLPLVERTLIILIPAAAALAALSRPLNSLLLGDEVARAIGVRVRLVRLSSFALASLITAALVSMAGPVGFIGLVAPWLAKRSFGVRFSTVLWASAAMGAEIAVLSDVIARLVLFPSEAPLTAVTSVFGAPLLVYILIKSRGE